MQRRGEARWGLLLATLLTAATACAGRGAAPGEGQADALPSYMCGQCSPGYCNCPANYRDFTEGDFYCEGNELWALGGIACDCYCPVRCCNCQLNFQKTCAVRCVDPGNGAAFCEGEPDMGLPDLPVAAVDAGPDTNPAQDGGDAGPDTNPAQDGGDAAAEAATDGQ